jgi:hypothetical protein
MRRHHIIRAGLAAMAAAALGAGLAQAMPANAAGTPATSAAKYVVLNCAFKPVTKPASWTPYCADYGVLFDHMHWTSWTSHLASGYGIVHEDDNYPNHAAGKTYTVPVLVTLWGSAAVRDHPGDRTYTTMTMIFPGKRPAVYVQVNGKWHATYPVTQTLPF